MSNNDSNKVEADALRVRSRGKAAHAPRDARCKAKAEGEYIRDQEIGQPDPWHVAMARFDAGKRAQALYAHCMKTKGYARAVEDDPL